MEKIFNVSINEYLGKVENGILVLLSIVYDGSYYESTFFYNEKDIILTISDEMEGILGCDIKKHPGYTKLLKDVLGKIVPYNEIIDRIDEVNFSRWVKGSIEL
jgi:hypothetical protein